MSKTFYEQKVEALARRARVSEKEARESMEAVENMRTHCLATIYGDYDDPRQPKFEPEIRKAKKALKAKRKAGL